MREREKKTIKLTSKTFGAWLVSHFAFFLMLNFWRNKSVVVLNCIKLSWKKEEDEKKCATLFCCANCNTKKSICKICYFNYHLLYNLKIISLFWMRNRFLKQLIYLITYINIGTFKLKCFHFFAVRWNISKKFNIIFIPFKCI